MKHNPASIVILPVALAALTVVFLLLAMWVDAGSMGPAVEYRPAGERVVPVSVTDVGEVRLSGESAAPGQVI